MRKGDEVKQSSENRKKDDAFCGTPQYFYINYPKQVIAAHDKRFFSFKKCYLDTIGKYKLGQQLERKLLNGSPEDLAHSSGKWSFLGQILQQPIKLRIPLP